MTNSHKIFLVEPIDKQHYPEMIVYADNEQAARLASMQARSDGVEATVYIDENMSICIETDAAEITEVDGKNLKVKYNDVTYDLAKNIAQEVLNKQFF